jgi:hypothetical protein
MPSAEVILSGLTSIANEWRLVAVFWHAYVAALLVATGRRRARSPRLVGTLLALPLLSVSALAWWSGNPFNGAVCGAVSLALLAIARGLPDGPLSIDRWPWLPAGGALVAFGWTYPHFLATTHWGAYLVAAPLGLVPCPTLAVMIGFTLILQGLRSLAWCTTLGVAGAIYGVVGVFKLAVTIDVILVAGATVLLTNIAVRGAKNHAPVRTIS